MRSTGYTAEDSSTGSRSSCSSPTPPRAARHFGCSGEEDPTWGRERIKNHWCWQGGPANDEHSGLVGGIGAAALLWPLSHNPVARRATSPDIKKVCQFRINYHESLVPDWQKR